MLLGATGDDTAPAVRGTQVAIQRIADELARLRSQPDRLWIADIADSRTGAFVVSTLPRSPIVFSRPWLATSSASNLTQTVVHETSHLINGTLDMCYTVQVDLPERIVWRAQARELHKEMKHWRDGERTSRPEERERALRMAPKILSVAGWPAQDVTEARDRFRNDPAARFALGIFNASTCATIVSGLAQIERRCDDAHPRQRLRMHPPFVSEAVDHPDRQAPEQRPGPRLIMEAYRHNGA